jgi:tripartite-type tricarboxylate transporter receptor subunit TctC
VVGFAPGAAYDIQSRIIAKHISRYLPGNPNVVVENKPGAGSILAANLVYNTEPKDGTVIASFHEGLVLHQALGRQGIQFDAARFQWLGATGKTFSACLARTDSGVTTIADTIGGRELVVGSTGPGSNTNDVPIILNAALGTHFRLISGYDGLSKIILAVDSREVDGLCVAFEAITSTVRPLLEAPNPTARLFVVTGSETPDHPFLQGVPAADTLAPTEEARRLLRAVDGPSAMAKPFAMAPEVPRQRVDAFRRALAQALDDPQLLAEWTQASQDLGPSTAVQVSEVVKGVLDMPAATRAKLKELMD